MAYFKVVPLAELPTSLPTWYLGQPCDLLSGFTKVDPVRRLEGKCRAHLSIMKGEEKIRAKRQDLHRASCGLGEALGKTARLMGLVVKNPLFLDMDGDAVLCRVMRTGAELMHVRAARG